MKNILLIFLFLTSNIIYSQDKEWEPQNMYSGSVPKCISYTPKYDLSIDNYLRIRLGGNSDAIIKLINNTSNQCIRVVYVQANDEYLIKNIPEGYYYVKIAFGNDWRILKKGYNCTGRFFNNDSYSEGKDLLDYFLIREENGYQIPSYEIILEVRTKNKNNKFDTEKISEEEFFNE